MRTASPRRPRRLEEIQRAMHAAVIRPLAAGNRMQRTSTDGRPMRTVAATFIKANDRLEAHERLEIYNRMYWFRIIDSFYDDNPGLRAVLGERRFNRLAVAYLARHPSRSFTLRNLCSRLEGFIARHPEWTEPRTALARDVARFEWAQTRAFDEASCPVITGDDLAAAPPARLRLGLQPYVQLLAVRYPVDTFVIAVKRRDALRAEASQAPRAEHAKGRKRRVPLPRPAPTWLAVHRLENRLYYKRLDRASFRILTAIHAGEPLARAVTRGGRGLTGAQVRDAFALWVKLGWLCRRK